MSQLVSNLAFMSQSPEKIGPVVEEKLKEPGFQNQYHIK